MASASATLLDPEEAAGGEGSEKEIADKGV
jgi:hypothetical protein